MKFTSPQWTLAAATSLYVGGLGIMALVRSGAVPWPSFRRRGKGTGEGVWVGPEWVSDEARLRHTHIVGATGSGKTVLLEQLLYRDLERGRGALVIDPKGDRSLYERVRRFCESIGRGGDLKLLSATFPGESVCWNPCRVGNASELQSKFYNSAIYSEPHYAKACELALLKVFNQLNGLGTFDLAAVVGELEAQRDDDTIEGLFLDFDNLVQGDWGRIISRQDDAEEVTLLDILRRNEILFVDLPTESQAAQSARIGRLLLQEITLLSGLRKLYPHLRGGTPFSVFIDEFDAFAYPAFATFLNKGRSSEFMIHLAHQTLSDLDRVTPAFRGQIMGNVNVRFIFRQDEPDDAESWSRFFGTTTVVKRTFQSQDGVQTGASSNREAQEFRVAPDTIKELKVGQCVFSTKTDGESRMLSVPIDGLKPKLPFPRVRAAMPVRARKVYSANRLAELAQNSGVKK